MEEDDLRIEAFGHMNSSNRRLIGCEVDGEEDFLYNRAHRLSEIS
jgi:hypothetical protein